MWFSKNEYFPSKMHYSFFENRERVLSRRTGEKWVLFQSYKSSRHTRATRIFAVGDYNDFTVLDPQDLTIVYHISSRQTLKSRPGKNKITIFRVEPDWISSYVITSSFTPNRPDRLVGVTMAGMIKVWSLVDLEKKVIFILKIKKSPDKNLKTSIHLKNAN